MIVIARPIEVVAARRARRPFPWGLVLAVLFCAACWAVMGFGIAAVI